MHMGRLFYSILSFIEVFTAAFICQKLLAVFSYQSGIELYYIHRYFVLAHNNFTSEACCFFTPSVWIYRFALVSLCIAILYLFFFSPLYTFILKTQRKQVKLLPMILVFDPMLSETTSFGFLPFWRFAGVRLKWQLPFSQCMVKPEEELFASNALLCGTSF